MGTRHGEAGFEGPQAREWGWGEGTGKAEQRMQGQGLAHVPFSARHRNRLSQVSETGLARLRACLWWDFRQQQKFDKGDIAG